MPFIPLSPAHAALCHTSWLAPLPHAAWPESYAVHAGHAVVEVM